jgi:hypothetical protein
MRKICIVGNRGNMGKRYSAICDYLNIPWAGIDCPDPITVDDKIMRECDGVIIATPSSQHPENLKRYWESYKKPILCEKPIVHRLDLVAQMEDWLMSSKPNVQMVNQYRWLSHGEHVGDTVYDFVHHGKDGLNWDCINLIGMAMGKVELKEESPIWKCRLNGLDLHIEDMDVAYITMVSQWVKDPRDNIPYIIKAHRKVCAMEKAKWESEIAES